MKSIVFGFEAGDFLTNANWEEVLGDDSDEYSKTDALMDDLCYHGYITPADTIRCLSCFRDTEGEEFIFGVTLFHTHDDTSDDFIIESLELPIERRYHRIKRSFCDFIKDKYPEVSMVMQPARQEWNIFVCEGL